jgi:hypothetical protein
LDTHLERKKERDRKNTDIEKRYKEKNKKEIWKER